MSSSSSSSSSSSRSSSSSVQPPCSGDCCYWLRFGVQPSNDHESAPYAGQYVRIWITHYGGFSDPNVFVYQRHELNPEDQVYGGFFTNIASPNDMEELSYGDPDRGASSSSSSSSSPGTTKPTLFRLDYVEIYVESRAALDQLIIDIKDDFQLLIDAMKRRCTDLEAPTYHIYSPSI